MPELSESNNRDHAERMHRARLALEGLSLGDAFGEPFFHPAADWLIAERKLPVPPWWYTDDTMMACSIVEVLEQHGRIVQDDLARQFARRFQLQPGRGYGPNAAFILEQILGGGDWRTLTRASFRGQGSMGNGGAMRAGPIGAYFADDLDAVVLNADASAEITHAHPDGRAGAIAVAVAAAQAWRMRGMQQNVARGELLEAVIVHTPEGPTREGLARALDLPADTSPIRAARKLGSGNHILAADTVPFAVWSAAGHLDSYEEAMWATVAGLGDRDTTCAIVGSIVVLATGHEGLPQEWLRRREPLA
ncbi:MAG: ADP-ribosylglycohydrolase family protein [Planctomycetota bacterium]